jgi:glutamine synthetase
MIMKLEYVWVDGFKPWGLRSKIKVLALESNLVQEALAGNAGILPSWGFDGSSTQQANGRDSDCLLKPVHACVDPIRDDDRSMVVMCEVLNADGTPHVTNFRHEMVDISCQEKVVQAEPWFGIEQEYTILKDGRPYGFPRQIGHFPSPQGIYYCSAGSDRAFGRDISDDHLSACINAGLSIAGTNAEVMPGQWEYQLGGPGVGPVQVSDELWLSRWFLLKVAEKHGMTVTFDPKPEMGDWNGAGCHTNFSTQDMRKRGGYAHIETACNAIGSRVQLHLAEYGSDIEHRLTGDHETCSYKEFKWGVADRTASIRIPRHVAQEGRGYLEDRRPNANCDPYRVTTVLLKTVCLNSQ